MSWHACLRQCRGSSDVLLKDRLFLIFFQAPFSGPEIGRWLWSGCPGGRAVQPGVLVVKQLYDLGLPGCGSAKRRRCACSGRRCCNAPPLWPRPGKATALEVPCPWPADAVHEPSWSPLYALGSVSLPLPPLRFPVVVLTLASRGDREENGLSCAELAFKMLLKDARSSAACHKLFIFSIIHTMLPFYFWSFLIWVVTHVFHFNAIILCFAFSLFQVADKLVQPLHGIKWSNCNIKFFLPCHKKIPLKSNCVIPPRELGFRLKAL